MHWKLIFSFSEHKIVIVGLDNAGKTTILYQFLMDEVVQTSPTIGSNVEEVTWKNIHFLMWDLGGQQSLRQSWATYFTNAEVSLKSVLGSRYELIFMHNVIAHHLYLSVCNTRSRLNRFRKIITCQNGVWKTCSSRWFADCVVFSVRQ